jgi:hypothetical protein
MPIPLLPLLASASQSVAQATTTPSDPISFQTALLVVLAGAIVFLAIYLSKLNRRLASLEAEKSPRTQPSVAAATPEKAAPIPASAVAPELVAAISAAVHTTLRARHRIISVGEICPNRQAWSAEGRRQVFSSHKVR